MSRYLCVIPFGSFLLSTFVSILRHTTLFRFSYITNCLRLFLRDRSVNKYDQIQESHLHILFIRFYKFRLWNRGCRLEIIFIFKIFGPDEVNMRTSMTTESSMISKYLHIFLWWPNILERDELIIKILGFIYFAIY